MKILNFILTLVAVIIAILVIVNVTLSRSNAAISSQLGQAQQLLNSMQNNRAALRTLATRVNQDAAQDNDLKAILQKLEITITPEPAAPAPH